MQDQNTLIYVQAAALTAGLTLSDERAAAVAQHFGRTQAMARLLDTAPMAPELEMAEIYCPAPFPEQDTPDSACASTPTANPTQEAQA